MERGFILGAARQRTPERLVIVMKPRTAELVLVTPDGHPAGSLPAVPVATPWWQDIAPVVRAARDSHGIDVTILRLLHAELDEPPGGRVTYLAEVNEAVRARPWTGHLDEHSLRHAFARPGGPAADLAWARARLAERGLRPTAPPLQVRTWNLSSLWRLPVEGQSVWLKVVPQFFAHEGSLLTLMNEARVPTVLGHDGGRTLLAEIPGEDLYGAALPQLRDMVDLLVALQQPWNDRMAELLALGLPDWRAPALSAAITNVVDRTRDELSTEDRITLAEFVRGLGRRFDEVAACGLRESLVHGDFHPGNFRGDGTTLTLLDWGDSGVGHPLLDVTAFLASIPADVVDPVRTHWLQRWSEAVPGSNPARASTLLAPIAAARQAVIYRKFLDNIEPSEHPYHRADPARWLGRTTALLRAEAAL
jgi:hypothetical protein